MTRTSRKIIYSFTVAMMTIGFLVTDQAAAQADGRSQKSNIRTNYTSPVGRVQVELEQEQSNSDNQVVISPEEEAMVRLLNQERAKAGLRELEIDLTLVKLARLKSRDMVVHNYFGHISQQLGTVYEQVLRENLSCSAVAENLIGAPNINKAEVYIMRSPVHRSKVLDPNFQRIGIGIVKGGAHGKMITQIFLTE